MPERDGASYANFGRRLAAYLLDLAIAISASVVAVGITMRLLKAVGAWVPAGAGMTPDALWNALGGIAKLTVIFAFLLSMGPLYFALCEASPWQATFGKRLLNIYVTSDDGKRISIARSFGRWAARWILNGFGLVLISLITIAATKKRKGLHDFAAGTLVLRGRPAPGGALEPWRIAVSFGFPFFWTLGTFLATM